MRLRIRPRAALALAVAALVAACAQGTSPAPAAPADGSTPVDSGGGSNPGGGGGGSAAGPYDGTPPVGTPIGRTEGSPIGTTGWSWIPFPDTTCTDAVAQPSGALQLSTSTTGLAVSWGPETSTDVVFYLQGGGACWDFFTCGGAASLGLAPTAATGPFGPQEFQANIYEKYPNSWVRRANLPPSMRDATIVFIPYCTGDVHSGDQITTYPGQYGLPSITWHHVGHANVLAFLKRLGPTFPSPAKIVVAGSSAGGFGSLTNYPAFRWYWPSAKGYLVDDSGPPLAGDAIPKTTRDAWYASWNIGASLDPFCPSCAIDLSQGLAALEARYPADRIALLSHLTDLTIRGFFGTFSLQPPYVSPMSATAFETALRSLGTTGMDPATPNGKYFFPTGDGHPILEDPTLTTTPMPVAEWVDWMLSDSASWKSMSDP
jgi:Pectinacetylesterase